MLLVLIVASALAQDTEPAGRARANLGSYFSTDDYPAPALRRGSEGTVRFELEIDATGRVSNCTVTASSGDPDLDSTTCAILRARTRYSPARDAEGRPTTGSDRGSVTWRLPEDGGRQYPPFVPLELATTMRQTAAGVTNCTVAFNGQTTTIGSPDQCVMFQGSNADQVLASLGPGAELTLVGTILPDGAAPFPAVTARGEAAFDTRAEILVAPDGSVSDCRVIESSETRRLPGLAGMPNPCATFVRVNQQAFGPAAEPRRGQTRFTLYLKIGAGSPTP